MIALQTKLAYTSGIEITYKHNKKNNQSTGNVDTCRNIL